MEPCRSTPNAGNTKVVNTRNTTYKVIEIRMLETINNPIPLNFFSIFVLSSLGVAGGRGHADTPLQPQCLNVNIESA
jgi:hypothetical protein